MKTQQQIEQELSLKPFAFQQKVEACKALYIAYQGRHHDHIQIEMRKLGNDRWNNRCLYARWTNGKYLPGWPERFGWNGEASAVANSETRRERNLAKSRNRSKQRRLLKLASKAGIALANARNGAANAGNAAALGCTAGSSGLSEANNPTTDQAPAPEGGCVPGNTPDPNSPNFLQWLQKLPGNYNWTWKFQQYVIKKLEAFERGDIKRLMLFVPPRHGKSELVTVRYAAWHLHNNPKSNIIIGSYNQKLANRFSRRIKNVYAEALAIATAEAGAGAAAEAAAEIPSHDKTTCTKCIEKAQECPHAANAGNAAAPGCTAGSPGLSEANNAIKQRRANTDAEWETPHGGGIKAVGCGSGITGFGANLIIIDDPVKSRSEAESQTVRDKAYDWFNDDIYTRLEPDGKMILIQTRWHEDDLAGRLLREMREDEDAEQWEVINFPAIAEESGGVEEKGSTGDNEMYLDHLSSTRQLPDSSTPQLPTTRQLFYIRNGQHIPIHTLGDPKKKRRIGVEEKRSGEESFPQCSDTNLSISSSPPLPTSSTPPPSTDSLGRLPGEALCPERYPIKSLLQRKKRLGTYSFSALYQQRPIPAEGGFFKRHWFKIVDHIPPGLKWKRGYDLGISASPGADYTATARVAFDDGGNMYIDRVLRRRMEYPEQRRAILGLIATEHDTEHFIEKSANGNAVIQDLRRERGIAERHFRGVEVRESKTARAFTWNALAEEGRVHLIRSAWNQDFIDEACSFPGGVNDDQIDAVSIAVKMLGEEKKRGAHGF